MTNRRSTVARAVALGAIAWIAACGDGAPDPVEPTNQAPVATGAIPAHQLTAGEAVTIDVAPYFSDPDGDPLTYGASGSDASVVSVSVSGSTLTIAGVAAGRATVTVAASDPGGLSAQQSASVIVESANQPPDAVGSVPGQTIAVDETATVDVAPYFSDPDGDALSYDAASADEGVATVSVTGSTLTGTAVARGTAIITVTATDPGGLSAEQSFQVTVPNRAPEALGSIPSLELTEGDTTSLDLSARFSDPDGDTLSYAAASSDANVTTAQVSGDAVVIVATAEGAASITVTATDPGGLTATQTVDVTVATTATIYNAGETIPTLPTGHWIPDFNHGVKYRYSNLVTVRFEHLGYIEEDGTRYTCLRSAGCTIVDGQVIAGPIRATMGEHSGDNHQPVATGTIPDRQLWTGRTTAVSASSYFVEPNGDPMAYTVASSDPDVAAAAVSVHTVTISAVAEGVPIITITASDPEGLTATQEFAVAVKRNVAPVTVGAIPAATMTVGQPPVSVDVSAYFSDPGDSLTYAVATSNAGVATVSASGTTVEVAAVAEGSSTVTVTASDPGGLEAQQEWAVTVRPNADRAALVAFYEAAGGDNWDTNSNWLTDTPLGEWHGVQVNRNGQVISLVLNNNNLKGRIAPEIGDLSSLETLSLRRNWRPGPSSIGLTGPIPPEIGRLSKLSDLRLSSNELTGRIPAELGRLTNLARLDLGWNDLTGTIPDDLATLTNLDDLDLAQNNLTGTIPTWIADLSSLTDLNLHGNGLRGEIPSALADLSLSSLDLSFNSLSGSIPTEFANLTNLLSLFLRNNQLTGDIPTELGSLPRLVNLQLNYNRLTGAIPDSFLNLDLFSFFAANNESVCLPNTTAFATWLSSIAQHDDPPLCGG